MTIDWKQYNLEQLHTQATHTFRLGGGSRPDVLLIEIDGEKAVLKDHNSTDKWFALFIGPLLAWRECKALTKLSAVSGIPNLIYRPDSRSFLMSYHNSEQVNKLKEVEIEWPDFFEKMNSLVNQIHQQGVAHNDLRNPTNTLVTPDGEPILVDLVACFCQGQTWNLPANWLFNKFCAVDYSAITKLKTRLAPELLNDDDIHAQQVAGNAGMAARKLGQLIRKASRKLFTTKT